MRSSNNKIALFSKVFQDVLHEIEYDKVRIFCHPFKISFWNPFKISPLVETRRLVHLCIFLLHFMYLANLLTTIYLLYFLRLQQRP